MRIQRAPFSHLLPERDRGAIAVLSPIGLTFGLIYARTKSLLLVILLHGLVDWLPNLADFVETWT